MTRFFYANKGMPSVSSSTDLATSERTLGLSRLTNALSINSATVIIWCSANPRVVYAGVPNLMPLVTKGLLSSKGTVFLLMVI